MLYAGSIAWVIGYDTIYAHQDAEDDALIGIKSTARLFGARTHRALAVFYALAVVLIGVALVLAGARWPAWIGLAAFAAHLVWQIRRLDIGDPALCLRIFKSNRDAGLLLFAGLLVDAVMRAVQVGSEAYPPYAVPSLRSIYGSRQCANDDKLRDEDIHSSFRS